ncbi:hypothetical protein MMC25_008314 [Agyrium rufum]|nr:hypothetical protein [Agyrium rufum]
MALPDQREAKRVLLSQARKVRKGKWKTWPTTLCNQHWTLEVLSLIIAGMALAAIFITLTMRQNLPIPRWPSLISINALVSVFTLIFKATLLFPVAECIGQVKWHWFEKPRHLKDLERLDAASRGPWGSVLLLFTMPTCYLATTGALITLTTLAIDPFTQQVITYIECSRLISQGTARIPRANRYTETNQNLDGATPNALYRGFYDPPETEAAQVTTQCPGGNCTFPADDGDAYQSLSICKSCTDITKSASPIISNWRLDTFSWSSSLPSGLSISGSIQDTSSSNDTGPLTNSDMNVTGWLDDTASSLVVQTLMLNPPFDTESMPLPGSPDLTDHHLLAVECTWHSCIKTYGSSQIIDFRLEENIISEVRVPASPPGPIVEVIGSHFSSYYTGWNFCANQTLRHGTWVDCTYTVAPSDTNVVLCYDTLHPNDHKYPAVRGYTSLDCFWTWQGFASVFGAIETFLLPSAIPPPTVYDNYGASWAINLYANGTANSTSVSTFIGGIANSLAANLRENGDQPTPQYAQGDAYTTETRIRVQWRWLLLPCALYLFTIIYSILIARRARHWQRTWKSSSLALLFHGFDSGTREAYGALTKASAMDDIAEQMHVQLADWKAGWRFVPVKEVVRTNDEE